MKTTRWLLALPLLMICQGTDAAVVAGGGTVAVAQGPDVANPHGLFADVRMTGALSSNVTPDGGVVVRFQFVRPDSKAIAFFVLTLPDISPLKGVFMPSTAGTDLLYYEQAPGDDSNQLFVSSAWAGEIAADEPLGGGLANVTLAFHLTIVDEGPDGALNTADDLKRTLKGDKVQLALRGDLSGLSYTYVGDEVYVSSDTVIIYEDGCSGSPDYYDDYDYYDSPDYTDETDETYYEDDWEGSSCDGDTYDDSDSGSDWDDSGDSSCSADDDYGDVDSGGSSCEGDSYDDDEEELAAAALHPMGKGSGPRLGAPRGHKKGMGRMAPLLGALLGWMVLRLATRRRLSAAGA